MLRRNTLSVVLLPGEVLYDGFLSAVTVELTILFRSEELNAAFRNVLFNHLRKEQVSHVTSVGFELYF